MHGSVLALQRQLLTRMSATVTSAPRSDDSGGKFFLGSDCGSFMPCAKTSMHFTKCQAAQHSLAPMCAC